MMRFEECNWMDIESYLEKEDRVILVFGATEQHGYLSLLTDSKIPLALADAVSNETGVLVAPVLNFGSSPYFLNYPGTISLRITTLLDAAEDVVESLYNQGFKKMMVLNGHGGNEPIKSRLNEILNRHHDLHIMWYSWWLSHSVEQLAIKHQIKPAHANWMEAFPFTKVTEMPEGDKTPPHYQGLLNSKLTRKVFGDGSFGSKYQVDQEIMNELFDVCFKDILHLIQFDTDYK